MEFLRVEKPGGYLYIITDSHVGDDRSPPQEFTAMLDSLEEPHTVILLGDLFKYWLAHPKFWGDHHRQVMEALFRLKTRVQSLYFIVGNREVLLAHPNSQKFTRDLPFTGIYPDQVGLIWSGLRFGFEHGDLINTQDRNYLLLRKLKNQKFLEKMMILFPSSLMTALITYLEKKLDKSNKSHKMYFPEEEIEKFTHKVFSDFDGYFVGHFHSDRKIIDPKGGSFFRVVPDWLSKRQILSIDPKGQITNLSF